VTCLIFVPYRLCLRVYARGCSRAEFAIGLERERERETERDRASEREGEGNIEFTARNDSALFAFATSFNNRRSKTSINRARPRRSIIKSTRCPFRCECNAISLWRVIVRVIIAILTRILFIHIDYRTLARESLRNASE